MTTPNVQRPTQTNMPATDVPKIQRRAQPNMPATGRPKNARLIDPNATRYGWMGLHPIDLRFYAGVNYVGDYTDQKGRECIPAKQLITFIPQQALALNEVMAVSVIAGQEEIKIMDGYEAAMLTKEGRPATRTARISPAYQAYMLMRDYERRGMCLFEESAGLGQAEMDAFFDTVLPPDAPELVPCFRSVLEQRVPEVGLDVFLDQYRAFFQRFKLRDAQARYKTTLDRKIAGDVYINLSGAIARAWSFANATLNSTEANIRKFRNGHKGKEFYDSPDERFADTQVPLDIICLAETGRAPITLTAIHEAQTLAAANQTAVMSGMENVGKQIADALSTATAQAQPQAPQITLSDIQGMFAERESQWEARLVEERERIRQELLAEMSQSPAPAAGAPDVEQTE